MWQFLASLPIGIAYGVLFLAGCGLAGVIWLGTYTLYKGGKIRAGKVELDAPEEEKKEEKQNEVERQNP